MQCVFSQKPLSTDEALDSLSAGFMTSTAPAAATKQKVRFFEHLALCCESFPHLYI